MSSFWGMDTAQVEDFGGEIETSRGQLEDKFESLRSTIDSIVGSAWIGPDADNFARDFHGQVQPLMDECLELMHRQDGDITKHIEEQNKASDGDGDQSLLDMALDFLKDLGKSAFDFTKEFYGNYFDNLVPSDLFDLAGIGATGLLTHLEKIGKISGSAAPIVGGVVSGLLAGAQRFASEGDRPMGERIGRAAADAAGTGLGAGGGAAAGALIGAAVGGPVGALIGGAIGGYLGGAAGGAVADTCLD